MNTRPKLFKDMLGQKSNIETLKISVVSARKRNDALGHVLLDGPPGTGKTTIAQILANEMSVNMRTILGSNISSFKDILPSLCKLKKGEILFIDEIHTVNKKIAESLYTVLEDFRIDIPNKKEDDIQTIDLPRFTMIGATTESGLMPEPLRDRFKLKIFLEPYSVSEISRIVNSTAQKIKLSVSEKGIVRLAMASRGTPRIANALVEWARDYGIAKELQTLSESDIEASMAIRGIGPDGSTENDRRYYNFLKKQENPVGIDTICASIGVDKDTVTNVIEPYLLRKKLIQKTPKGRKIVK